MSFSRSISGKTKLLRTNTTTGIPQKYSLSRYLEQSVYAARQHFRHEPGNQRRKYAPARAQTALPARTVTRLLARSTARGALTGTEAALNIRTIEDANAAPPSFYLQAMHILVCLQGFLRPPLDGLGHTVHVDRAQLLRAGTVAPSLGRLRGCYPVNKPVSQLLPKPSYEYR